MPLGIPREDAKKLVDESNELGPMIERLGLDHTAAHLITSLHTICWFKYGADSSVIVSNRGGRQECWLGGLIFNMIYA